MRLCTLHETPIIHGDIDEYQRLTDELGEVLSAGTGKYATSLKLDQDPRFKQVYAIWEKANKALKSYKSRVREWEVGIRSYSNRYRQFIDHHTANRVMGRMPEKPEPHPDWRLLSLGFKLASEMLPTDRNLKQALERVEFFSGKGLIHP